MWKPPWETGVVYPLYRLHSQEWLEFGQTGRWLEVRRMTDVLQIADIDSVRLANGRFLK